jgi:hypothetical protein
MPTASPSCGRLCGDGSGVEWEVEMPKIDISVRELVDMIDRGELRLPELQRRYVWPATRVRDLVDSLYRGYPSGTILVWETTDATPARDLAIEQRTSGFDSHKLLLDGQQRLTSLSAVLRGEPLRFKNRVRPVDIAFNLDHPDGPPTEVTEVDDDSPDAAGDEDTEQLNGDGLSIQERVKNRTFVVSSRALLADPHWVKVSDIFNKEVRDWDLLKRLVSSPDDPLYDKYGERLQRVRKIEDYQYVMHLIERDLSYEEVAEIFVRVNSLGMKLRGSDLAMAQVTARWPGALDKFDEFAEECEKVWFTFDSGLLVRTLVVFATGQSRFRTVAGIRVSSMEESWEKAKDGLRFAINFLRTNAGIEDESLLSSPLLVIPIAVLGVNRKYQFSDDEERDLLHWLFVANATGHFTRGSSESILDADLAILRRGGGPPDLLDLVKQQFGRIRFSANDFTGRGSRNPLFQTTYLAVKHAGAKDWRSGLGLSLTHSGRYHYIQTHHIFPKGVMKQYEPTEVNEIANFAFISGGHNRAISSKTPDKYIPEIVEKRGVDALVAQGIPTDPELWRVENFRAFLEYRRAELARMVNNFLDGIVKEGSRGTTDVAGLIAEGEGPLVEFKETARFNSRTSVPDKVLEAVVVKTVAGFLNAHGGTLVIGVDDSGTTVGLDHDIETLSKKNVDGYELFLRNLLNGAIGADLCTRIGVEFPTVDGTQLCALRVPNAPRPVWINVGNDKVLYVRSGNSTQPLDSEQAHRYVTSHWHS